MKSRAPKLLVALLFIFQVFFYPMMAFAETTPAPTGSEKSSSDQSQTSGTSAKPDGPDALSYLYNPATGLWENEYYTWDPASKKTAPKTPPAYSYNPQTGMWDTTEYQYDASSNTYKPQAVANNTPPTAANDRPTTAQPDTPTDASVQKNQEESTKGLYDLFYDTTISNTVTSKAQSGSATVMHNTAAGNATSGDATSNETIINMLQASLGVQPGAVSTFTTDIYGNQLGDITLNPHALPAGTTGVQDNTAGFELHVSGSNKITNNIDLTATSGDTLVHGNTKGGNASSGNALAVANVVNMINTSINTGQSFIGSINIYGNLDGDILLPETIKQQLLSGNTPTTTIDINKIENADLVASLTTNTDIKNNVLTAAASGNATVDDNTKAGNAASGSAKTNLTVLNLTGQEIIGDNSLLVFVNVMGSWVGAIMNAPAGTTAATLGGEGSNIRTTASSSLEGAVENKIENNITVQATSGDASVVGNTQAGNATTGNATASANLLNIANTSFSVADWFGILFINVFGSWNGSFGQNTTAGGTKADTNTPPTPSVTSPETNQVRAFRITSSEGRLSLQPMQGTAVADSGPGTPVTETATESDEPQVLAASSGRPNTPTSAIATSGVAWPVIVSAAAMVLGVILMLTERVLNAKSNARVSAVPRVSSQAAPQAISIVRPDRSTA